MTLPRRVVVPRFGDPGVMRIETGPALEPRHGEVLVRVLAAGVAHADVLMRAGRYPGGPRPPFVPGWDIAGTVEAVGPGVPRHWIGQRVAALILRGGYASHVTLPVVSLVPVEDGVGIHEAACLTLNYVTAFELLHHVAQVRPGERVLIHGAAGGVGTALLDLGRWSGLDMYGTASAGKRDVVASFGATFAEHNAHTPTMDVVFDALGGAHLTRSFRTLHAGGRLVSYGFLSHAGGRLTALRDLVRLRVWSVLPNNRRALFYRLSTAARTNPGRLRETLAALLHRLEARQLRPLIAERVPMEKACEAHRLLQERTVTGKVLLIPSH
ncbi:alcohol dehydrogenase catalytic domain-containing protein [Allorhizocola rhizosphaerae]|uniref:alcohol dehydrogenase catalytic domain-containing protein n=1 Tax=Allorhizocola rhizosphaerae TaxID=1872709 RepID=UPI000E3E2AAC|nr:zinc-binding dehydrogenase [Allorhizocola rhizosphaerae]